MHTTFPHHVTCLFHDTSHTVMLHNVSVAENTLKK